MGRGEGVDGGADLLRSAIASLPHARGGEHAPECLSVARGCEMMMKVSDVVVWDVKVLWGVGDEKEKVSSHARSQRVHAVAILEARRPRTKKITPPFLRDPLDNQQDFRIVTQHTIRCWF